MGRNYAEFLATSDLSTEQALRIHLQHNHYPPVHEDFVPACLEAIERCNEEDYEHVITMCNGKKKTARDIVEGLHLESFLEAL